MSREIKFRQLVEGRWYEFGWLEKDVFTGPPKTNKEKYPTVQYTGLKDKNGVEIYEGDIIDADFEGEPCPSSIVFEDGSFRIAYPEWDKTLSKPCLKKLDIETMHYLVIGNIHQNPELLK